ncbi:MAG TPA: ribosomal protein S18-alanine N-acetyltransferase [Microvirga sp.]|nr:ribosomal protein S18-alanine N-acetyltransferase [Microvirga sp.]
MNSAFWPLNLFWNWWLPWFDRAPAMTHPAALTSEHAERLAEIHEAAFARPWGADEFERLLADRAVTADGLFAGGGSPCGFALSRRVLDEAEILTIAIAPEARGRGHGRTLLLHHLDALARAGIRLVHLEVEEGNRPAIALYRRLGFEEIGRRPGYYAKPDGTRLAAITMSLKL